MEEGNCIPYRRVNPNEKYTKYHAFANSEAVKYYDTTQDLDTYIDTMESLNKKGVKFVACNNALIANNIEKHNIIHFVDIVPAGVLELVVKQN